MSAVLAGRPATPFPAPTTTTTIPRFVEPPDPSGVGPMTGLPDVRGLPVAQATTILQAAGFRVATLPAPAGDGKPGTVVVQSPPTRAGPTRLDGHPGGGTVSGQPVARLTRLPR